MFTSPIRCPNLFDLIFKLIFIKIIFVLVFMGSASKTALVLRKLDVTIYSIKKKVKIAQLIWPKYWTCCLEFKNNNLPYAQINNLNINPKFIISTFNFFKVTL